MGRSSVEGSSLVSLNGAETTRQCLQTVGTLTKCSSYLAFLMNFMVVGEWYRQWTLTQVTSSINQFLIMSDVSVTWGSSRYLTGSNPDHSKLSCQVLFMSKLKQTATAGRDYHNNFHTHEMTHEMALKVLCFSCTVPGDHVETSGSEWNSPACLCCLWFMGIQEISGASQAGIVTAKVTAAYMCMCVTGDKCLHHKLLWGFFWFPRRNRKRHIGKDKKIENESSRMACIYFSCSKVFLLTGTVTRYLPKKEGWKPALSVHFQNVNFSCELNVNEMGIY